MLKLHHFNEIYVAYAPKKVKLLYKFTIVPGIPLYQIVLMFKSLIMTKFLPLFLFIFGATINFCQAQVQQAATVNATGGSAQLGGNTYEWSVGEMVLVNTVTTSNLVVTQGLLQPILNTTDIRHPELSADQLKVYPNPTKDIVFIQPNVKPNTSLTLLVFDISGRAFYRKTLVLKTGTEVQTVDLGTYAAGNYLLDIVAGTSGSTSRNTFKIQKLN